MKRILPYLLSFLFLYNVSGYYLVFELNKAILKQEIRSSIQSKSLQIVILDIRTPYDNPDFVPVEEEEFIYEGNLYDVVKEEVKGDTTRFYCIHDKKEQLLVDGFRKTMNSKSSRQIFAQIIKIALPPASGQLIARSSRQMDYRAEQTLVSLGFVPSAFHPPKTSSGNLYLS